MYTKNSIVLKRVNMLKLSRREKLLKHEKWILNGYSRIYDAGNLVAKWSIDV